MNLDEIYIWMSCYITQQLQMKLRLSRIQLSILTILIEHIQLGKFLLNNKWFKPYAY